MQSAIRSTAVRRFLAIAALLMSAAVGSSGQSVTAISFSLGSVIGGNPVTGAVRLTSAAPPGGAVVSLVSDNTAAATVPGSVTVAAGATIAHFPVATYGVASTSTANVTATYNGSVTGPLQVFRAFISSVGLAATALIGSNSTTGTVYLNGQAPPGGLVCMLSTTAACAQVPASVTVAAGTTNVTFTVTTTPVASSTALTVDATALGSTRGVGLKVWAPYITSVSLSPAIINGNLTSVGTINLAGPAPSGGFAAALSSTTAWATVPASVTVGAGGSSATFTVSTTSPHTDKAGTLYATVNGSSRGTAIGVLSPRVAAVVNNTSVSGYGPIPGGTTSLDFDVTLEAPPWDVNGYSLVMNCDTTPAFHQFFAAQPYVDDWLWSNGTATVKNFGGSPVPDPAVDTTITITLTDIWSGYVYTFTELVTHT